MQEILQRLLRPEEPPRRFCKVTEVLPDGRYKVTDSQGRSITVDGDGGYLAENPVIIQSGRIVGMGRRKAISKVCKV